MKSGVETALSLKLLAKLGTINIAAQPKDALLYIDGRLMGRASQEITLPAKEHQVLIQKEGYVDYKAKILPRPGLSQVLQASLKTVEQVKWEKTPEYTKTSNGHIIKLFKPDGAFTMGTSRREAGRRANEVQRTVSLSRPFYLSTTLVSNRLFRQFSSQHSSSHYKGVSLDSENYPAVNVTWHNAALYCNWLSERENLRPFYSFPENAPVEFNPESTGYRLPTEAEWAWIARVNTGTKLLKYPWGHQLPPKPKSGNYADLNAVNLLGQVFMQYDDKYPATSPVAVYPANQKGIFDIGGNASEWIHDYYEMKTGLALKTENDPVGPLTGDYHVIRGSSWMHSNKVDLRLSFRDYGVEQRKDLGFRIARWVE